MSGLVFPIFFVIPLWVYWHGYTSLLGQEPVYWALRGAYLASTILMFRYLFSRENALKQFKMLCGLFPVYGAAILAALFYPPGRKPPYRVNNRNPFAESGKWWCLAPHLVFIILHGTLPFLSLWLGWALPRLIACNAIFSAVIIWVLADLVVAAWSKPHWSTALDPRQAYGG